MFLMGDPKIIDDALRKKNWGHIRATVPMYCHVKQD
jgi:hypothetical protein